MGLIIAVRRGKQQNAVRLRKTSFRTARIIVHFYGLGYTFQVPLLMFPQALPM